MRRFVLPVCLCLITTELMIAQQLPVFSQYTFDAFLLNPAAAGSEGYTTINVASRLQWMPVDGAPRTCVLAMQTRLYKNVFKPGLHSVRRRYTRPKRSGKVGLGFNLTNDNAGAFNRYYMQFSYAFHMNLARAQLSLGSSIKLLESQIDVNKLIFYDGKDKLLLAGNRPIYAVDLDFGLYYTNQYMFAGVSVENITKLFNYIPLYPLEVTLVRGYNLIAGYNYKINPEFAIEPSLYFKSNDFLMNQLDANVRFIISGSYWVGCSYRTGNTLSYFCGIKVSKLYFGYAYDQYLTQIHHLGSTHEIMMAVKLGDNVKRYKWLERY